MFLFIKVFTYNFQGTRKITFFLRHYSEEGEKMIINYATHKY